MRRFHRSRGVFSRIWGPEAAGIDSSAAFRDAKKNLGKCSFSLRKVQRRVGCCVLLLSVACCVAVGLWALGRQARAVRERQVGVAGVPLLFGLHLVFMPEGEDASSEADFCSTPHQSDLVRHRAEARREHLRASTENNARAALDLQDSHHRDSALSSSPKSAIDSVDIIRANAPARDELRDRFYRESDSCWEKPRLATPDLAFGGMRPYEVVSRYRFDGWKQRSYLGSSSGNRSSAGMRVLLWTPVKWYLDPAQRLVFMVAEALQMHPDVAHVDIWGEGFCGFAENSESSVQSQFISEYGPSFKQNFDLIIVQELAGQVEHPSYLRQLDIPIGVLFHECRAPYEGHLGCDDVIRLLQPAFALFANGDELLQCCLRESERRVLSVGPVNLALNPLRFNGDVTPPVTLVPSKDRPALTDIDGRTLDVVLVGVRTLWYPLRMRLASLIGRNVISHADVIERLPMDEYRNVLRTTKIVLADASSFRLPLQKIGEAACSGALVMGEVPLDFQKLYRQIVVPLDFSQTDEEIADAVAWWLLHDAERRLWASRAQAACRQELSVQRYTDLLLDAFDTFGQGEYGVMINTPLRFGCRAVQRWNADALDGPNAWCDAVARDLRHYGSSPDSRVSEAKEEAEKWRRIAVYLAALCLLVAATALFRDPVRRRALRSLVMSFFWASGCAPHEEKPTV